MKLVSPRALFVTVLWGVFLLIIGSTAFHYVRRYTENIPSSGGGSPPPDGFETVEPAIKKMMRRSGVASVAVAVAKNGRIIWEEGFGWADRRRKIPATPETAYRIASLTKPFTVTGLMTLVEKGLADLDRPVNDYLEGPGLVAHAGNARDATLRRLVYHTSGLPMYVNLIKNNPQGREPAINESIREYGILVTAPGERYCYSNLGYGIIGHAISRISGRSYSDFMREEVFEPLGMAHTSVLESPVLEKFTAVMYDSKGKPIAPYDFDHRGASAILSSARDLVRFGMFHLNKPFDEQERILDERTVARMHEESGAAFADQPGGLMIDYLLGSFARVDYGGFTLHVATGGMPGATSRLGLVPTEGLVTVVLCNGENLDLWEVEKLLLATMLPGFGDEPGSGGDSEVARESDSTPSTPDSHGIDSMETVAALTQTGSAAVLEERDAQPDSFVGSWLGSISTSAGPIPLRMAFSRSGSSGLTLDGFELDGKFLKPIRRRTALGESGFHDGCFSSVFFGKIDTGDAAKGRHVVMIECRFRGGRLTGYAAAVAIDQTFIFPYWMELRRFPG